MQVLNTFTNASGQKINLNKSGITCGLKLWDDIKGNISDLAHIPIWDTPGKYLGVPAEWGTSKTRGLTWLKEKIMAKMVGKGKLLNQVRKETLIKAIIQEIPTYVMSIVQPPKTFCSSISAPVARFWWASHGKDRCIHWKARGTLFSPKDQGGMSFKDFSTMNSSLLAKQAWRNFQNPSAPWASLLKGIYFPHANFSEARVRTGSSWVWKCILHVRDIIIRSGNWTVATGQGISISNDCWVASGTHVTPMEVSTLQTVDQLITDARCWNIGLINQHFSPHDAMEVLKTPISWSAINDSIYWPFTTNGEYYAKSGYRRLLQLQTTPQ